MDVHLTKDEKEYIQNNASNSYLLLKHEPRGGIDNFIVYNQNKCRQYSIDIKGWYRKRGEKSPTLTISDETGAIVGTLTWNNEFPSTNPFIVHCVNNNGSIEIQYEQKKRFFRKSWYKPDFADWTLDYNSVYADDGQICAEIKSISNYKKTLRGVKKVRDSYLINRYYNTVDKYNDVLVLLFWAIRYICDDYEKNHEGPKSEYVQKTRIETKLDNTVDSAKSSLKSRRFSIDRRQDEYENELHNRARTYENEKRERLQEKIDSKTQKQKILSVVLKVFICLLAPVMGVFIVAIINQLMRITIDFNFVAIASFIVAILAVNRGKPEWVLFYEWLKLALLCIFGFIACSFINVMIAHLLERVGIKGIDTGIPLLLLVIMGICKWMSRYIDSLVKVRPIFSIIQCISLGLLAGQICTRIIDGSIMTVACVVVIVAVIILSKANILVRKTVRHCIVGIAAGIIIVTCVIPLINMLVR